MLTTYRSRRDIQHQLRVGWPSLSNGEAKCDSRPNYFHQHCGAILTYRQSGVIYRLSSIYPSGSNYLFCCLQAAEIAEHLIEGFAFDAISLASIDMRQDHRFQSSLLYPTAHGCVIDTKNASNFRDSQQITHYDYTPFLLIHRMQATQEPHKGIH